MSAPFLRIVAGSDGHRGRAAAALAQVLARAAHARLLLVGVQDALAPVHVRAHAGAEAGLESALRSLRDEVAPEATIQIAIDSSPADALRRVAEAANADLIVVGSMHRGRLQRLTSGDRAMQVLHGAPCAVAIAPDHVACRPTLLRIGVGIDGSAESGAALDLAVDLAQGTAASLVLMAVASDVYAGTANPVAATAYADMHEELIAGRIRSAREELDRARERCAAADVPAYADVRLGDPARELAALGNDCDLLVLGSRRWGPVRRLALGSTAERVIRDTACPVLVPPRDAATEHQDTPAAAHAQALG